MIMKISNPGLHRLTTFRSRRPEQGYDEGPRNDPSKQGIFPRCLTGLPYRLHPHRLADSELNTA